MRSKSLVVLTVGVFLISEAWVGARSPGRQATEITQGVQTSATSAAESGSSSATQPQVATSTQAGANAQASVPRLIRFSGILQNLTGKPIAGPVDVTFSLYTDEAAGVPLWFETQTVQTDSLGHYTALLGAMTPTGVPMELFTSGEAHWLGVQVAKLPEQARVLLVSVPYAMKAGDAETLGGKPSSAYQLLPESDASSRSTSKQGTTTTRSAKQTTSKSSSPTPQVVTTTQNYVPVFADNLGTVTNSIMYQSGARIGINTNAPAFGLDLNSNIFAIGPKAALPGGGGTMRFRDDTATVRWLFGIPGVSGSTDFFIYNYTNGHQPLYIQGGAYSNSLYLSSNGNVGVGTTSPAAKLDVVGNINVPVTATGGAAGVIKMGGLRFIHACCATGQGNTFVGFNSGNFTMTGSDNTIVGDGFQLNSTGIQNSAIGEGALAYNSSGSQNTAGGVAALYSNQGGIGNTSLGYSSMFYNTNGNNNTAVGFRALYSNTTPAI